MKKNRREYKDGTCFKTRAKYIKPKHQIKLELIRDNSIDEFRDYLEYNKFLESETNRIYNSQFETKYVTYLIKRNN